MSKDYVGKRKEFAVDEHTDEELLAEKHMEPETRNGIISNAPNVNVRESPTSGSPVITTLSEGTKVTMKETSGKFVHVHVERDDHPSVDGFVHSDYCKEDTV